jgi:hypothetical protein
MEARMASSPEVPAAMVEAGASGLSAKGRWEHVQPDAPAILERTTVSREEIARAVLTAALRLDDPERRLRVAKEGVPESITVTFLEGGFGFTKVDPLGETITATYVRSGVDEERVAKWLEDQFGPGLKADPGRGFSFTEGAWRELASRLSALLNTTDDKEGARRGD